MLILTAAVALVTGYLLGHLRTLSRTAGAIEDWAWRQTRRLNPRRHAAWWLAQGVFAVMCGMALVFMPRQTLRNWRDVRERRRASKSDRVNQEA